MSAPVAKRRALAGGYADGKGSSRRTGVQAPVWTASAAFGALAALDAVGEPSSGKAVTKVLVMGSAHGAWSRRLALVKMSAEDRALAHLVVAFYRRKMASSGARKVVSASCWRRWRSAAAPLRAIGHVTAPGPVSLIGSFRDFLSSDPSSDRGRCSTPNVAVLNMVDSWPPTFAGDCAIAPERVRSRVRRERGGVADVDFLRGAVAVDVLPTLTASPSDHWFLPKGRRWFTVPEVMRAHGVLVGGCLWNAMLTCSMTPAQCVAAFGRGVHCACARYVADLALGPAPGDVPVVPCGHRLSYASMFSGVDTFADGFGGAASSAGRSWRYLFAVESVARLRACLVSAWGGSGLCASAVYADALSVAVARCACVDVFVFTPDCGEFSARHHGRSRSAQVAALELMYRALQYVRVNLPRRVIVENVDEPCGCQPIGGILGGMREYVWAEVVLCPRVNFGLPVLRKRRFWVGWLRA